MFSVDGYLQPAAQFQKTLGGGQISILGPRPALKILTFLKMPIGTVIPLGLALSSLFRDQKQYQNKHLLYKSETYVQLFQQWISSFLHFCEVVDKLLKIELLPCSFLREYKQQMQKSLVFHRCPEVVLHKRQHTEKTFI